MLHGVSFCHLSTVTTSNYFLTLWFRMTGQLACGMITANTKCQFKLMMIMCLSCDVHGQACGVSRLLQLVCCVHQELKRSLFSYILIIKPTRCTNFSNLFLE